MEWVIIDDYIEEPDPEDLILLNIIHYGIPRQIYERANYFHTMDNTTFRKRFRLSKETVHNVLTQIEHYLEFPYDKNNCVSPINQLLACLRLFATGGHLDTVGDFTGMHYSTVSRIIVRVAEVIADLSQAYICMPDDRYRLQKIQQDFFNVASFPQVIGAIDCSHFRILSPGGADPEVFRNRKGYFSINGQFVCDSNLRILNVVARWPGSCHDSTIFNNSRLKQNFENNMYRGCLLLGDNGYGNKTYLMTPLLNPTTEAEQVYNDSHIRTRNVIERLFGILKRRFPILAYGCRLKVETFLTIIVATAVLHNIALLEGDNEPPPLPEELDEHILNDLIANGQIPIINEAREDIQALSRAALIHNYFQHLIEEH